MGFKVFRTINCTGHVFSLDGDEEEPNEAGLNFYDDLFDECHKYGIEPVSYFIITLKLPWDIS